MLEKFRNPITGQVELLSQEDIITLAQTNEARKGSTAAYTALLDSAHDRVAQAQMVHVGQADEDLAEWPVDKNNERKQ